MLSDCPKVQVTSRGKVTETDNFVSYDTSAARPPCRPDPKGMRIVTAICEQAEGQQLPELGSIAPWAGEATIDVDGATGHPTISSTTRTR